MREQNRPGGLSLINPPGLYDPAPNGYSHVALLPPGARLAFIAGQGGETADGQLSEDFRQQVRQALRNLCIAIEAAGGTPQQIARLGVLIVDHSEARLQVFGDELARALGPGRDCQAGRVHRNDPHSPGDFRNDRTGSKAPPTAAGYRRRPRPAGPGRRACHHRRAAGAPADA